MVKSISLTPYYVDKFWSNVSKSSGCWLWTGAPSSKGYGVMRVGKAKYKASRVSWTIHNGDPGLLHVLHMCDNRMCVNPRHLFLGLQPDNMKDRDAKGRQAKGSKNGKAKTSKEDIIQAEEIRRLWSSGDHTQKELGIMFGYSRTNIGHIVRGDSRTINQGG